MTRVYEASRRVSESSKPTSGYLSVSVAVDDPSSTPKESVVELYTRETQSSGNGNAGSTQRGPDVAAVSTIARLPNSRFSSLTPPKSAGIPVQSKLIASGEVLPAQVEQYRRLSVALQELQDRSRWSGRSVERGLKTVLVTSALPREGKTLTVLNVAHALSDFLGRRVLVIDADLHSPSIHNMLGLPNTAGLSDILCSSSKHVPFLQVSPLMSVLPAGHRVPARGGELTSDQMRTLLEDCSSRFDWVLLDAPAVGLLPHLQQLSQLVRAVLLVIGSGSSTVSDIDKAISAIGHASIIGTVFNRVNGND
jgi:Mrp family chromosome partitioning ATPase